MKYFKAKASDSKSSKRRSAQEGAEVADDQPQTSAAAGTTRMHLEKGKDPYRRQRTGWKRSAKATPPPPEPLDANTAPAAGDVQVEKHTGKQDTESNKEQPAVDKRVELEDAPAIELHDKEQQTSAMSFGVDVRDSSMPFLEEYGAPCLLEDSVEDSAEDPVEGLVEDPVEGLVEDPVEDVAVPPRPGTPGVAGAAVPLPPQDDIEEADEDTDEGSSLASEVTVHARPPPASTPVTSPMTSLDQEAFAVSARLSAELHALASLVEITTAVTPSEDTSTATSESVPPPSPAAEPEPEGIRSWQHGFMARLKKARQRNRDIRLKRKEVLSIQLMMETVLKQYMALSREVETVKASLKWEALEPVSLSRVLSRLQAQRKEEATNLTRLITSKDAEVKNLQTSMHRLHENVDVLQQQVEGLQQACREKDEDLERAATALVTMRSVHKKTVQELSRQFEEKEAAASALHEKHVAEHREALTKLQARQQAEAEAHQEAIRELLNAKHSEISKIQALRDERERELQAAVTELRGQLAAIESTREFESMRLSRALSEKEMHLNNMTRRIEELHAEHGAEAKALRAELHQHEQALRVLKMQARQRDDALAARDAELAAVRVEAENTLVALSKALSERDHEQSLREAMEGMRREHERQQQCLQNALDVLRSQKDIESLNFDQIVNEKDLRISELLIDLDQLRNVVRDCEARLQHALEAQVRAEEAHAGLLKTVEAMNARQEELTRELHQAYAERTALTQDRARKDTMQVELQADLAAQGERLRHALDELERLRQLQASGSAEGDSLRRALEKLQERHAVEVESLQKALEEATRRRESDAAHFREALHEKDLQIRDFTDQFVALQREREREQDRLLKALDEKDEEAVTKTSLLETKNEDLAKTIADQEKEIGVLKNAVSQAKTAHKERISSIKFELEKKSSEALELDKAVRKLKQSLETAKGERKAKEAELERSLRQANKALASERAQHADEAKRLRQSLSEREEQLSELARQLATMETEKSSLRMDVDHLAKQKDNYQVVIEEKDKEISALRDKVDRLRAKFDGDLEAKERAVNELQCGMQQAEEQREALVRKFSKILRVVRTSFEKRSAERSALQRALDEANAQHAQQEDTLIKKMLGKENEMKQLRENLHQYEDHLRCTREEMDATIKVLKMDVHRLNADVRKKEVELEQLHAVRADNERLRQAEQLALEKSADLEKSLEDRRKRVDELELELELNKTVLKKNTEECRTKTEKLQQNVEKIRQERDSELAVLKDMVTRLEEGVLERDRRLETIKAEHAAQLAELQYALECNQNDAEALADQAEKVQALQSKEQELRQTIEYLEGDVRHKGEHIAVLEETIDSLKSGLDLDVLKMKDQLNEQESENMQLSTKVSVLEAQMEDHISLMARKITEKDREIKDLSEAKASILNKYEKENNDLVEETHQLLSLISKMQKERLEQRASTEARLEEREAQIQELTASSRAKDEELERLSRLVQDVTASGVESQLKEERAKVQELIQTMNGALRAKDEELEALREAVAETESLRRELESVRRELDHKTASEDARELARLQEELARREQEIAGLREVLEDNKTDGGEVVRLQEALRRREQEITSLHEALTARVNLERESALTKKDAELKVLNLTAESLRAELRTLKERVRQHEESGDAESQLRARDAELEKHKQTIESLRVDLNVQKQLLLAFPEGRAYLDAPSEDSDLSRTTRVLRAPLAQDGDHRPTFRPSKKHLFSVGDVDRGALGTPGTVLKRTASENDSLDLQDLLDSSDTCLSSLTFLRTPSDLSTTSSNRPQQPLAAQNTVLS